MKHIYRAAVVMAVLFGMSMVPATADAALKQDRDCVRYSPDVQVKWWWGVPRCSGSDGNKSRAYRGAKLTDPGTDRDPGTDPDTDTQHSDNGNHYGNDKPDNNDNDDKNKHDGEESKDDHHDNNGGGADSNDDKDKSDNDGSKDKEPKDKDPK
jgi:cobalamin biosynthesis protein CobT